MKVQELTYRGHLIEIWRDSNDINSFEDWDGLAPTITKYDKSITDYSKGDIYSFLTHYWTEGQLIRHQKALLEIMGEDFEDFKEEHKEHSKEEKAQELRDCIEEIIIGDFDLMEQLCNLYKIECINRTSRGYSQSDWSDVFIVCTDDFYKKTGALRKNVKDDLQSTFDIYEAWAWGDVYGYSVEGEYSDDSCGGYYGEKEIPYMIKEAKSNIDYSINQAIKKRAKKIKAYIINKVPLIYRESFAV